MRSPLASSHDHFMMSTQAIFIQNDFSQYICINFIHKKEEKIYIGWKEVSREVEERFWKIGSKCRWVGRREAQRDLRDLRDLDITIIIIGGIFFDPHLEPLIYLIVFLFVIKIPSKTDRSKDLMPQKEEKMGRRKGEKIRRGGMKETWEEEKEIRGEKKDLKQFTTDLILLPFLTSRQQSSPLIMQKMMFFLLFCPAANWTTGSSLISSFSP